MQTTLVHDKRHSQSHWRIARFSFVIVIVVALWPQSYLASPRWEVWVVDEDGKPLIGMNVRLSYQNYSAEDASHEVTLQTDENGYVLFQPRFEKASLVDRACQTISSAGALVHASFGRHAWVFAFGNGREGSALAGEYVADWTGEPQTMQSRIVAKPFRSGVR